MSIDFLFELERAVEAGKEVYACPGLARNQWVVGRSVEDLRKTAKRAADSRRMAVNIVRLISKNEAIAGDLYLVPVNIGDPGTRGEPSIQWSTVETREAAELMKDVRRGPPPYFGMQIEEVVEPHPSANP